MKFQRLLNVAVVLCFAAGSSYSQTGGDAVIYPDYKGPEIEKFFFDIKGNAGGVSNATKAAELFVEDDMNGIRVSIYGDDAHPAHPSAGVVVASEYTAMINSIKNARAARVGKDFYVFASKKLDGQTSFPAWVKDKATGPINVPNYVRLLTDYIMFMKSQDIEIDILGIDNENQYNEGDIMPALYRAVVDSIKKKSVSMGFKMPLFVGYEDYGPNKNNWMKTMRTNNWIDRMDIYGAHYYPHIRPLSSLKSDLSYTGKIPFWSTEPHWDNKADADDWVEAEEAICTLWDQTDVGMSAFMWWAYARSGSIRGNLMREFSVPLKNARLIDVDDIDGRSTTVYGKLQTHAFRENDLVTVYAVNNNATTIYTDYGFSMSKGIIVGDVSYRQYIKSNGMSPRTGTAVSEGNTKYRLTIPQQSITIFSFKVDLNSTMPQTAVQTEISVQPSIATDIIHVSTIGGAKPFSIFDMAGKVCYKGAEPTVSVVHFKPGIYFVKSESGAIARFVKK